MRFAHIVNAAGEHRIYDAAKQSEARLLMRFLDGRTLFQSPDYPAKALEFPADPLAWMGGADPREAGHGIAWLEGPCERRMLSAADQMLIV